jgi:hypothetical protein
MEIDQEAHKHKTAEALYKLRLEIAAARAVLAEDDAIARPLPTLAICLTDLWNDALSAGKLCAWQRLTAARECAHDLMGYVGGRAQSELGTLIVVIKENIEWAMSCLGRHGNKPNNDDRMAASHAIETGWQLSATAIRQFVLQYGPRLLTPVQREAANDHARMQ